MPRGKGELKTDRGHLPEAWREAGGFIMMKFSRNPLLAYSLQELVSLVEGRMEGNSPWIAPGWETIRAEQQDELKVAIIKEVLGWLFASEGIIRLVDNEGQEYFARRETEVTAPISLVEEPRRRMDLGQLLLEGAFIRAPELQAAQETARCTGRKLAEVLLTQNLVTPETLATVYSFQYNAPIIDLKQFEIQPQALALIPEAMARDNNVLPLAVDGDMLTVAMEDPGDLQLIDALSSQSRKRIRPVIPLHGGIREAIDKHYKDQAKA